MNPQESEIQFPIDWQFRIITEQVKNIHLAIEAVFSELGVQSKVVPQNQSESGRYQSFSVDVVLTSRELMNQIDREVRAIAGVKMIL